MKKYVVGALIGFVLSLGVSAHAEVVNMIGKVIDGEFPIKINGKAFTNQAITIAGVSYVPTREFAESLGATVKFDANSGIEVVPPAATPAVENPLVKSYNELNDQIGKLVIEKQALEKQASDIHVKNVSSGKMDGDDIKALNQQAADKQAQIDKLVIDKNALEAQMQSQP